MPYRWTSHNPSGAAIASQQRSAALFERGVQWTVRVGDTGNKIAAQLGVQFFQLAFLNPTVHWRFLQIGSTLNVPGDGSSGVHAYTVVAGDTGNAIAAANGITFAQLDAWNCNVDWYNLQVGQTLSVPSPEMDTTRISQMPNVEQAEQDADVMAQDPDIPTVPVVSTGTGVTSSTKSISPLLIPGETFSPSSLSNSHTLKARQVQNKRPVAPQTSISTSAVTTYTVKAGDTGYGIAAHLGINFDVLDKANPGVDWQNLQIGQSLKIPAGIRTSASVIMPVPQGTLSPESVSSVTSSSLIKPTIGAYVTYSGSVSDAQPPYPPMSSWILFDQLWTMNSVNIGTTCDFASGAIPPNTASESASLKSAILAVSSETGVNPSFILAEILQESNGCVRVPTTSSFEGISNPGLMQSFRGRASCNRSGRMQQPCPYFLIKAMIEEGIKGNRHVGIVPALLAVAKQADMQWPPAGSADANATIDAPPQIQRVGDYAQVPTKEGTDPGSGVSDAMQLDEAMLYYQAARIYNSGSLPADGDLSAPTASTRCYVSDVVNRLLGWTGAGGSCSLKRMAEEIYDRRTRPSGAL